MLKTLTIAKHTLKEALGKKILLVLGLFFITIVISSLFLEVPKPEDRIKLVERISFGSMAFFGVIVAIFLSATSLPNEIEEKQIYTVMTKPIGRIKFLLGKILGLVMVVGLLLLLMAIFSLAMVRFLAKGEALIVKRVLSAQRLEFSGEGIVKRGEVSWLRGPEENKVIWHWQGLKRKSLLQEGKAEAIFRVISTAAKGGARRTELKVLCISNNGEAETGKIVVEDDKPTQFRFDRRLIDDKGRLQIEISRINPDYAIGVEKEALRILASPGNFDLNFLKVTLLLLFEFILIIVITVMGSTFLCSLVSVSLGLFTFLAGHMVNFLKEVVKTMEAVGFMTVPHHHGQIEEIHRESQWLTNLFESFLHWFTELFPNLQKFEVSSSIIAGVDVSLQVVRDTFLYMSIYALVAFIVACLIFRFRQFK